MPKNQLTSYSDNIVLHRYRKSKRDVEVLRVTLIEERQRIQAQISNLQEQMSDITNELAKTSSK
jgi:hypothetical protein